MYHKRIMKDKYQLSRTKDGQTGKVKNKKDLDAVIDMFTKAVTKLFYAGRAINIAIISEDGNVSKIEVDSFAPSNF